MIAVIGRNGQLGWELVRKGKQIGLNILELDFPEIDISRHASVEEALRSKPVELVINAAAYTAVDRAESETDEAFAVNRDGPANLAEICRSRNIPLIHVSTDYVFDGTKKGSYNEEDTVAPLGVYGESKAAGEAEVRKALPEHIILRTAWMYGIHGNNFVKTMLKLGGEQEILRVVADQYGCPTYAAELAEGVLAMVHQQNQGKMIAWGTYHFCGRGSTTWHRFAETIFETAKRYAAFIVKQVVPVATTEYPTPARRPANSVLDCTKIERNFGIRPRPWKESLNAMLAAFYLTGSRNYD